MTGDSPTTLPDNARIERELSQIWREALQTDEVGVDDGFSALGGESLTAARVLQEIKERFEVEVSLSQFYATRTVSGLTRLIGGLLAQRQAVSLEQAADAGDAEEGFL